MKAVNGAYSQVPVEARRGHLILWNWSLSVREQPIVGVGTKARSSGSIANGVE